MMRMPFRMCRETVQCVHDRPRPLHMSPKPPPRRPDIMLQLLPSIKCAYMRTPTSQRSRVTSDTCVCVLRGKIRNQCHGQTPSQPLRQLAYGRLFRIYLSLIRFLGQSVCMPRHNNNENTPAAAEPRYKRKLNTYKLAKFACP